jgi:sortase A
LSATVLEGTDDATLRRGAGHIEETPFPGEPGNIGIAGHRDTIFRSVRNLRAGDPLVLTTADRVYQYRITKTRIVNPDDVYVLDPTDHPTLTLVTCYPSSSSGTRRGGSSSMRISCGKRHARNRLDRRERQERRDGKDPAHPALPARVILIT